MSSSRLWVAPPADPGRVRAIHLSAGVCAAAASLGAALIFVGIELHLPSLATLLGDFAPARPKLMLACLALGLALLAWLLRLPRLLATSLAVVAGLIAAVNLGYTAVGVQQSWFDMLLTPDWLTTPPELPNAGRVGTITSIYVVVLALVICCVMFRRLPNVRSLLALGIASMAMVGLFSQLFGVTRTPMGVLGSAFRAPPDSVVCILLLAVSAILAGAESGWTRVIVSRLAGGSFARVLLPAIPLATLVVSYAVNQLLILNGVATPLSLAISFTSATALMFGLVAYLAVRIDQVDDARERAHLELEEANRSLERRLRERTDQLRRAEREFRAAFDQAPVGMALTSPEGQWVRINSAIARLVGYSEAEALMLGATGLIHPDDLAIVQATLTDLTRGNVTEYRGTWRLLHRDGSEVPVAAEAAAVTGDDGKPAYVIAQLQRPAGTLGVVTGDDCGAELAGWVHGRSGERSEHDHGRHEVATPHVF